VLAQQAVFAVGGVVADGVVFGRYLVLHWNDRQMRWRGVGESVIKEIARGLGKS